WLNTSTTAAAASSTAYGGTTQPVSAGTAVQYTPPTSAPVSSPSTPSLPTVALTSQVGAGAMNALQAIASQPGNVKLSTTGGTTYSGWQWDAMAKVAFGNAYIPLSSIPGVAG